MWNDICLPNVYLYTQTPTYHPCTHLVRKNIAQFKYLEKVDLSYNHLKTLKFLSGLKFLTEIRAV